MMQNAMIAQSGGPTAAINATLAGVIRGLQSSGSCGTVYGALHGITGVIEETFLNLSEKCEEDEAFLNRLVRTPAMYLGSCRIKMPDPAEEKGIYDRIFVTLEKYRVGWFFYIGGNDSMDTITKLSGEAVRRNSPIRFVGVPKTIDNDLVLTDHTPGYGSAAKYIASSMLEIAHDTYIYDLPCVTIVEIMGRDAGWLTASASLARNDYNETPQLVYLPEVPFHRSQFLEDVRGVLKNAKNAVVAVSEGIRDENGVYISAKVKSEDKFGHMQLSGVGKVLENLVKQEIGTKVRSIELSILQRCAGHIASAQDIKESGEQGEAAARMALDGETGVMPAVERISDEPYSYRIVTRRLEEIANQARRVPREWINEAGNDVTEDFIRYARPLILGEQKNEWQDGLPYYLSVKHLSRR
ncbi:MAG: 6-phosphofructokinase [Eubacterium sp.]|nr:6-phosphofructokinase [Eubacterium sp.]